MMRDNSECLPISGKVAETANLAAPQRVRNNKDKNSHHSDNQ